MIFSVVIPVFNVEDYLESCVRSVLDQDFENQEYEIILVNDGSTDSSGKICNKLKNENENVLVIHKENGGLSDARNHGVLAATGEYIFFLDSDDKMTFGALRTCAAKLVKREDLLICNQYRVRNDKKELDIFPNKVFSEKTIDSVLDCFIKAKISIPWAAYQNIYRRDILINENIFFQKGLVGAEDCEFFFRYIDKIMRFSIIDFPVVEYLMERPNSIMTAMKRDAIEGRINTFKFLFFKFENDFLKRTYFAQKYFNIGLDIYKLDSNSDIELCIKSFKSNKVIIYTATDSSIIYKLIYLVWIVAGEVTGSKIINFIRNKLLFHKLAFRKGY